MGTIFMQDDNDSDYQTMVCGRWMAHAYKYARPRA